MKKNTSLTGKWIAELTQMSHPSTVISSSARRKRRAVIRIRKKHLEEMNNK